MESVPVIVKHQGKRYNVDIDLSSSGETLKYQLFSLTGVEPDRQKILIKGGQLKDDTELSGLGIKPGHTLMMMGTPSSDSTALLERPKEKIRFVEDMTEAEVAKSEGATPAGLMNLGNTCYMNSTLQTLRSIPELQEELLRFSDSGPSSSSSLFPSAQFGRMDLTTSLRDLFKQMSETQAGFPPVVFLNALRTAFPQFAQKAKDGHGFAQQDAEEAWSQIISQLRQKLKTKDEKDSSQASGVSFIDKYMSGQFESIMECDDQAAKEAGEEPVKSTDQFFKLNCHISADINHLRDGLLAGLKEQIEKKSASLNRNAMYTKTSRVSRLPKYLTVHFVRFDWRRTTNKKAKIMRKVTFPQELDAVEFCTDGLKKLIVPVRDKIRDVRKEEDDIQRARKRQKRDQEAEGRDTEEAVKAKGPAAEKQVAKEKQDKAVSLTDINKGANAEAAEVEYKTDAAIEAERAASILAAKKQLLSLVDPKLASEDGVNKTGLYELRGVITHQGASADSGHYTAFIKKESWKDPVSGQKKDEDGKWWWFNDEKVSEVDSEKIETLSGGGQSHSALILLYRAIPLPTIDEKENEEVK